MHVDTARVCPQRRGLLCFGSVPPSPQGGIPASSQPSFLDLLGIMQSDGVETTQSVPQDVVFGEDPTFFGVPYTATLDGLEDPDFAYSAVGYGFGHHVDGCGADYLDVSGFVSLREHDSDVQEHCSWGL